jgi:hypothetical protein
MAVNPLVPWYLALGVGDSSVKIFDRRRLSVGKKADAASMDGTYGTVELTYLNFVCSILNVLNRKLLNFMILVQADCQLRQLTVPALESSDRYFRITSLTYSGNGTQILASYSSDHVYLFDLQVTNQSRVPL